MGGFFSTPSCIPSSSSEAKLTHLAKDLPLREIRGLGRSYTIQKQKNTLFFPSSTTYILTSTRRLGSKTNTHANRGVVLSGGVFPCSIVRLDAKRARILPFSYFLPPLSPSLPPAERPPIARWWRGNGQGLLLILTACFIFISLFTCVFTSSTNTLYCIVLSCTLFFVMLWLVFFF